jgi:hypothetical protein
MRRPNKAQITSKCVEVSKCLIDTASGLHTQELEMTRTTGDIARFVANIKGSEIIDINKLGAISSALKIDYRLLVKYILPKIEDYGWIETKKEINKIRKVDEHVPPIQDTLSILGEEWNESSTSIDEITVNSLYETCKKPITEEALVSELDSSEDDFKVSRDYGLEANYFGNFISEETGKQALWSPLYWAGRIDDVLKFLERQTYTELNQIGSLTRDFRDYPGTPSENVSNQDILDKGIKSGYFPSVSIKKRNNVTHQYIFAATPQFEVEPDGDIFEKARLIVSSMRAGQYHGEITKIKWPTLVLKAFRDGVIRPHSFSDVQYAPLVTHSICTLQPVKVYNNTRYKPIFIDTPENNIAADIAYELLKGEEPVTGKLIEPKVDDILKKGVYNYTSEMRRIKSAKKIEASDEFEKLIQRMSGSGVSE